MSKEVVFVPDFETPPAECGLYHSPPYSLWAAEVITAINLVLACLIIALMVGTFIKILRRRQNRNIYYKSMGGMGSDVSSVMSRLSYFPRKLHWGFDNDQLPMAYDIPRFPPEPIYAEVRIPPRAYIQSEFDIFESFHDRAEFNESVINNLNDNESVINNQSDNGSAMNNENDNGDVISGGDKDDDLAEWIRSSDFSGISWGSFERTMVW